MTRALVVACSSGALALGAIAACASAEVSLGSETPSRDPDGGAAVLPDGGVDADRARDAGGSNCSAAGWCETALPDEDLTFKSIWPFENLAFATAESPTLGLKVLEWQDAKGQWSYIDDNSQNRTSSAVYIANLWAANENDIYYAAAKGTIVHGTRPSPDGPWTWTSYRLEDHSPVHLGHTYSHDYPSEVPSPYRHPALGVWGTKDGDMYAWYTNTIYHFKPDGSGAPAWVAEYIADDAISDESSSTYEELFALGAAGVDRDDLWFSFVRTDMRPYSQASCPVVVRKTSAGYERIFDGIIGSGQCQEPRPGYPMLGAEKGWLTGLTMLGAGRVAGIVGGRQLVRIEAKDDGYTVATSMINSLDPVEGGNFHPFFASLYLSPEGRMWMAGTGTPGTGMVVAADDVWDAGESYDVSTLSISGAPLVGAMYQIRGTSNTNLWLVGARHAMHKTNP